MSSETKNAKIKYKYCKYVISINCVDTHFSQEHLLLCEFINSLYFM